MEILRHTRIKSDPAVREGEIALSDDVMRRMGDAFTDSPAARAQRRGRIR
ncbi:hypothetical protein [Streptomyces sp. NPDC051219]